jgi:hypothetical protein
MGKAMQFTWADSPDLEQLYLEVSVNPGLGVLVLQESRGDEPTLIFCSLIPDAGELFNHPKDRRDIGLTIGEIKSLLASIEKIIASRPFPPEE